MTGALYKLVVNLESVEEKDLPALISTLREHGRRLHADLLLISGAQEVEIVMYGEDLVHDKK